MSWGGPATSQGPLPHAGARASFCKSALHGRMLRRPPSSPPSQPCGLGKALTLCNPRFPRLHNGHQSTRLGGLS